MQMFRMGDAVTPPKIGTLAYHCGGMVCPTDRQRLDASMSMVAPRIDLLLEVGATPVMVLGQTNAVRRAYRPDRTSRETGRAR